jgi:hypothetical protein
MTAWTLHATCDLPNQCKLAALDALKQFLLHQAFSGAL